MSVQYNRALAEQKTIEGVIRELAFKRSHLLTQAVNTKMEIDSYEKRLAEVKLNVELYKPIKEETSKVSPPTWPVLKTITGPSVNRPEPASKVTSEHTEIEDIPLQSPPRIPRHILSYREFMRKYHQWSPDTEIEKPDEIEEFPEDGTTTLAQVLNDALEKQSNVSVTQSTMLKRTCTRYSCVCDTKPECKNYGPVSEASIKVEVFDPKGNFVSGYKGSRSVESIQRIYDSIKEDDQKLDEKKHEEKKPEEDKKPFPLPPSPLVRVEGGKGPRRPESIYVIEDSDYDSDKTDTIFVEEGGWIGVADKDYDVNLYQPPRPKTPKRPIESPVEPPGAPKKTKLSTDERVFRQHGPLARNEVCPKCGRKVCISVSTSWDPPSPRVCGYESPL